jgi:hypothetical protein
MNDVFIITGPRGSGKTMMAATYLLPDETEQVFWHDSERSASRVLDNIHKAGKHLGHYLNLPSRFRDLPSDDDLLHRISRGDLPWRTASEKSQLEAMWTYILEDLDKHLARGQFRVYVHDTIAGLEAAMVAWCDTHVKALGVRGSSKGSPWGEFWTAGVYEMYNQLFEAVFARGVEAIILTTHLKAYTEDNKRVPGKVQPGGKPWLTPQASLMLWLVNTRNADGAPAALVLKERLGELTIDETGNWKLRQMLPRRIPHCTWVDIRRYLAVGCDLANPAPGETPSESEIKMIEPYLFTNEQLRLMVLDTEMELEALRAQNASVINVVANVAGEGFGVGGSENPAVDERATQAKALQDSGMDAADIAAQMSAPLPLVRRWLEG